MTMRKTDEITYKGVTLSDALEAHRLWLELNANGERLIWDGADLNYASLNYANLNRANLNRANLNRANLNRANLIDASLNDASLNRATGNMREIKSMHIDKWGIAYTADDLQIGCQRHAISKWRKWDTDAGRKWIEQMDDDAAAWADRNLGLILQIIDANPATPTGHETEA